MNVFSVLLLVALPICASAAVVPTEFVVSPDKSFFQPVQPFRAGDRLQVQSPFIDEDDLVALARCLDSACTDLDIVRVWTSHRRHQLRDYVNIQHDGNYIFFANAIPRTLADFERHGCLRSAPLRKVCIQSQRMAVTEVKQSQEFYRARFSSDTWFWVRKIRSAR